MNSYNKRYYKYNLKILYGFCLKLLCSTVLISYLSVNLIVSYKPITKAICCLLS